MNIYCVYSTDLKNSYNDNGKSSVNRCQFLKNGTVALDISWDRVHDPRSKWSISVLCSDTHL